VIAVTKIVPIICPGCKNPIFSKDKDEVFLCPTCGTLHARNGKVTIIEYETGAFKPGDGEKLYLPFWKLGVDFTINNIQTQGGGFSKFAGFLKGNQNAGHIDMLLPAYNADPTLYKTVAERMTFHPPAYTPGKLEPGVSREPCGVTVDMTDEMADFMFVTIEAEKSGVIQQLDYSLKVMSRKMLYLPYFKNGEDLKPGF
jgi:hypothetical protein